MYPVLFTTILFVGIDWVLAQTKAYWVRGLVLPLVFSVVTVVIAFLTGLADTEWYWVVCVVVGYLNYIFLSNSRFGEHGDLTFSVLVWLSFAQSPIGFVTTWVFGRKLYCTFAPDGDSRDSISRSQGLSMGALVLGVVVIVGLWLGLLTWPRLAWSTCCLVLVAVTEPRFIPTLDLYWLSGGLLYILCEQGIFHLFAQFGLGAM